MLNNPKKYTFRKRFNIWENLAY